ncbi:Fumarate reductase cytochrome b subunit [hydrothermal vent metagenome]|uniref:Fumarate reductase cytochrome b subunit n=1 Tax=hydrothermal vent metagenome TaxID=652676 RepID=A0A1W1CEY8_9ZZZZ
MTKENITELLTKKDAQKKKSRTPARLDFIQSATGAVLALFIIFHLIFESSILLGKDSMYHLTKMFEAEFIIDGGEPLIISGLAFIIFVIFIVHALIAMRKFPASYSEYKRYQTHRELIGHSDTNLWFIQISSGFAMFFLGSIHLYIMMTQPQNIGPFASSDRIYSDVMWPMYLMLLVSVVLHAGVGVYRLIVKWGVLDGDNPRANRLKSRAIVKGVIVFYLLIGLFSLGTYIKIGYEHRDDYGKKYTLEQK